MPWFNRLTTSKVKIYAVFQFLWIVILILNSISVGVGYENRIDGTYDPLDISLGDVFTFSRASSGGGVLVSVLAYIILILVAFSWLWACLIYRFKSRSIFDTLFGLFFFIPVLSNIIALIAQITKLPSIGEIPLDEQAIYDAEWERLEADKEANTNKQAKKEKQRLVRRQDK